MAAVADVVKCWANTSLTNFKFVTYLYGYCSVQITVWDVLHLAIYLNSYLSSLISVWSFLLACASERFWTRRRLHLYSVPGGKHGLRRATCKGELDLTQYFSLFFFSQPSFFSSGSTATNRLPQKTNISTLPHRSLVLWLQQSSYVRCWTGVTSQLKTESTGAAGRSATRRKWVRLITRPKEAEQTP